MGFFGVSLFLLVDALVMAVGEFIVIVGMGMPGGAVLPLAQWPAAMVMGHMIVIVAMSHGRMRMLPCPALAVRALRDHG